LLRRHRSLAYGFAGIGLKADRLPDQHDRRAARNEIALEDQDPRQNLTATGWADLPFEEDRPTESPGVLVIFDGIRDGSATDQERLERGCTVCDALYVYSRADARAAT
jgi:hypothetical protein